MVLGNCSVSRSIAACPRCEEPLSTTQNTRSADLYGLLGHHLLDQRGERNDAGGVLAAAVDLRAVHVVRGEIGHRAATVVVVVDPHHPGLARWQGGVAAAPRLDGGLLVGGDHIVSRAQRFPVPFPGIQIQHFLRLLTARFRSAPRSRARSARTVRGVGCGRSMDQVTGSPPVARWVEEVLVRVAQVDIHGLVEQTQCQ